MDDELTIYNLDNESDEIFAQTFFKQDVNFKKVVDIKIWRLNSLSIDDNDPLYNLIYPHLESLSFSNEYYLSACTTTSLSYRDFLYVENWLCEQSKTYRNIAITPVEIFVDPDLNHWVNKCYSFVLPEIIINDFINADGIIPRTPFFCKKTLDKSIDEVEHILDTICGSKYATYRVFAKQNQKTFYAFFTDMVDAREFYNAILL